MTTHTTTVLPLLFSYRGPIVGHGYMAKIDLCGRLLSRVEAGSTWLEGVNPGAIAVSADSLQEANSELRRALTNVFSDFAEEAATQAKFRALVRQFFKDTDQETVAEWKAAVVSVRQGNVRAPDGLHAVPAETEIYVRVSCKKLALLTPTDNDAAAQLNGLAAAA